MEQRRRINALPVVYVSGSHYEVGFNVGTTFRSMIQEFLDNFDYLTKTLFPKYRTDKGHQIFAETLEAVQEHFPQYIEELQGTADGAQVPFEQLFLLHMDTVLSENVKGVGENCSSDNGCSTILCNQPGQVLLGHNEDALPGVMNHCYIVNAYIISDEPRGKWKITKEKFEGLCYAGHLPGFCMSHNMHGLAYSINIIQTKNPLIGKIPRHFISRALLGAKNLEEVTDILTDKGSGCADGMSVNLGFIHSEGSPLLFNIEVGPSMTDESQLSILTISTRETYLHCNRYKRLKIQEDGGLCTVSSIHREITLTHLEPPDDLHAVKEALGDGTDAQFPFFRESHEEDPVDTVSTGIFDFLQRTWSLYTENPKFAKRPLCVLPICAYR